jgi:phosphoserine phosphatase RsbU/P
MQTVLCNFTHTSAKESLINMKFDRLRDLGKRAGTEKVLQQNKTLRSVINSIAEGVIIANQEGKFIYFNRVAQDILGISRQDVDPGQWTTLFGCFYPDQITPYPAEQLPLALAMKNQQVNDELIFIKNPQRPDGVFISVSAGPIQDAAGNPNGGTVIIHDVTREKTAIKKIQQSEARLQAQFDGFPIPTYVWKKTAAGFILLDYNRAAYRITNGKVKDIIGRFLCEIYPDKPEIKKAFLQCLDEEKTLHLDMDHRLVSTGELKKFSVSFVPIPPDLLVVHTEDITERKQAEQELKKLSSAVEQTADSVVITDPHGVIVYVNPAFEKTTGYDRAEILGKNPNVLQSGRHDREFYQNLWKTISNGRPWQASIINKKKNGELYWCEQTITPMKDQKESITNYVSVIRDITDRKHRQEHEFQMRIAHEVQLHLSKAQRALPGFDMACLSHSAVQTSGDYYDYFTMFDGSISLCIADVSGHGIGAALIMAGTRAYLRALTKMNTDPAVILNALNQELCNDLGNNHYVTLMMARIDPEKKMLEYASAGHVPAFLLKGSGDRPGTLKSTGIPLGWIKDYRFEKSAPIPLDQGSLIVFITDGLSEAHASDDTEFGYERILDVIKTNRNQPAQTIARLLYEQVCSHVGHDAHEDDITAVICKVL